MLGGTRHKKPEKPNSLIWLFLSENLDHQKGINFRFSFKTIKLFFFKDSAAGGGWAGGLGSSVS